MRLDSRQSIQPQIRSIDGLSIRYVESELRVPSVNAEDLHERLPKSKLDLIDALHDLGRCGRRLCRTGLELVGRWLCESRLASIKTGRSIRLKVI
jgi:hypothetical protein